MHCRKTEIIWSVFCCAAELENSTLTKDPPAAHTSPDASSDLEGPLAETSHLAAESADQHGSPAEPSSSPSPPEESPLSAAEQPPSPSPLDLIPSSTLREWPAGSAPPQTTEHTQQSVCESTGSAHQCDHQHSEEEPDLM